MQAGARGRDRDRTGRTGVSGCCSLETQETGETGREGQVSKGKDSPGMGGWEKIGGPA